VIKQRKNVMPTPEVKKLQSMTEKRQPDRFSLTRSLPLIVLVGGIAAFFALGLNDYVTFDTLRLHRRELVTFVANMPVQAVLIYILVYAVVVAFSLPGAALLTLAGGFLFGSLFGTAYTVVAATAGSSALFLAARTALGGRLRGKAGPFIARMEEGFRENALSYLLALRFVPAFPFFIVNLVPALLGVSLRTYVIGTFLGIIPGTFVFSSIGAGLGSVFDSAQELTLKGAITPQVMIALVGLALLSLVPVLYKKIRARQSLLPNSAEG
jgi:uncharacterized membrane protein YdjX (TVP38/TMEM64 family)